MSSMKRVFFTCFLAIMLVSAVLTAGCTEEKRTLPPVANMGVITPAPTLAVPYGETTKLSLDAPATTEVYLTMTARANSKDLGGGRSFMRIAVNGNNITGERLVNKNLNFTYGDGFRTSYYSKNMSAWYLFFSPDFVGYDNPALSDHIIEGNAYEYKFDVSDIVNKGAPNEVAIQNIGPEVAAQYSDPKTIEFYKSAPIIVNPIALEGKGIEVVQFAKAAAPTRIIVGKKSTVSLTISNNLPGNITDVEFADTALPEGLSGQAVSGSLDRPIPSGGSYSVTYNVTAEATGTYMLGAASATFADPTGNYQKISSGTVTITVI
jgi:hypothetical protein